MFRKKRESLLLFVPVLFLVLFGFSLSGCGSIVLEQPINDESADNRICTNLLNIFYDLEILHVENELIFSFEVPLLCCRYVVLELYYEGEYLDSWESELEFNVCYRETITYTFKNDTPTGHYEVRIGSRGVEALGTDPSDRQIEITEEFQIE